MDDVSRFDPVVSTSWNPPGLNRIADYPDRTSALFFNNYGKGRTYVITQSLRDAVNNFPDLIRDIFDEALGFVEIKRFFDIYGMNNNMDVAAGEDEGKYSVMVSNYNDKPAEVRIRPLIPEWKKNFNLIDMETGSLLGKNVIMGSDHFRIKIDASDFVAVSLVPVN
jgi:hypothetical protein